MRLITAVLGALLVLATPAEAQTAQHDLDRARAQWAAAAIRDYDFTLRGHCFCPPPAGEAQANVVRDGTARTGRTVEQLFEMIQRAIDRQPDELTVSYGEYGVPVGMAVDEYEHAVDDEYGFAVSDFSRYEAPPPPPADPLAEARAAWKASGVRRHSVVVTRRCAERPVHVRRDWTVPRLHAFIARTPGAEVRYGRHGIPRSIAVGGCRYSVTRFRRAR